MKLMKPGRFYACALALAFSSIPVAVSANDYTQAEKEALVSEGQRASLGGWPSITFFCEFDEGQSDAQRVCDAAATEARLIAAQSKIQLRVAPQYRAMYASSVVDGALILHFKVRQTAPGMAPSGMSINADAWGFVSEAKFKKFDPPGSLNLVGEVSRSGELVLWSHPAAVGGSADAPSALVPDMTDAAEQILKRFFATFLEAQSPSPG
jgi:hypothetical protein